MTNHTTISQYFSYR